MARKPQTEKKAKGLISGVGDYRGRTLNLTKKQVAKSGVKGAVAAKKQAKTDIGLTSYVKGKGVMKDGKLFTGKVDLGGGNVGIYVAGKRIRAKAPGSGGRGGGGGNTSTPRTSVTTSRVTPAARGEGGAGRARPSIAGSVANRQGRFGGNVPSSALAKPTTANPTSPRASYGSSFGGRAGGTGPVGTPTQKKIALLKTRIANARSAAAASAAKAKKDAAARAQAQRDAAALRALERELNGLQ